MRYIYCQHMQSSKQKKFNVTMQKRNTPAAITSSSSGVKDHVLV